jgi:signal transduction histidine kinase/sugar lactone lactonase YvrE
LTEDREGNLWAGTGGGGLNRLRPRVVAFESERTGLPFETMRSLCEDPAGAVWAVSHNGLVWRWQNEAWQAVPSRGAWPEGQATCVTADPAGGVWLGMYHYGLHRWQEGRVTSWRRNTGLGSDTVRSLLVSSNGDLWIGLEASNCVQRLRDGQLSFFALPAGGRPVRAMAEDAAGDIWMGTSGGELLRATKDELVDETARTLPVPQPIRCLHWTPDGSLWIGYAGAGVGRLKNGKFAALGADHGLPDEFISFIESDGSGGLCIAGDRGVFAVRQRELDAVAEGRAERVRAAVFGRDEALPSLQANYGYFPASLRGRDGRLWFPMRTGLVRVRLDRIRGSHVPPPVLIERVLLDGRLLPRVTPSGERAGARFTLPPGHRKVDFEFTALSFIAPDNVHFRHWLEGWDTDWVDGDIVRHASYSRLPAGEYRFRVTACNNAGVWSETGAAVAFTVTPFFWQTWWFRLTMVAGFTAGVIGLVRYLSFRSLRRKLLRAEREAALQQERARIAKDIHDDLGASLTQIALLGELAQHDLAAPETMRGHIGRIAGTARRGVKSLEEIVWAVNPRNDTLAHLLDYAGQFAVDFLRAAEIRCRIDFPDHPPARDLPADVRHNLFLVVKEALNNIAKHAQASEVWLRAEVGETTLRLTIEDNGRGFTHAPDDAWADGLRNMRQRMAEVGGTCEIASQPGTGTKVTLTAPWRHPRGR